MLCEGPGHGTPALFMFFEPLSFREILFHALRCIRLRAGPCATPFLPPRPARR
jgi:hypothetical protein